MFSIQFNNLNSYKDLGLVVEHRPVIPIPQKNISTIEIEGRDGSLTEDHGTYKDIPIPVQFGFKGKNGFENKCRLIKYWLNNIKNRNLILSDDTDMFYKVKHVRTENIDRGIRVLGRFTVSFICEPFSYFIEGLQPMEIKKPTIIYAPELIYKSEPKITVYGSGDITLNINNNFIKLLNVQDYIVVDSTLKECYKDTVNCNRQMVGEFPLLDQENKISWTGNVSKIEIIPRWRCL